jgi:hypothetical protein
VLDYCQHTTPLYVQVPPADIEQPPLRPCGLTPKSTKSSWADAVRPIESVPLASAVTTAHTTAATATAATAAAAAAAAGSSGQKVTFQVSDQQQQQQQQQGGAMHAVRPSWGATTTVAINKVGLQSGGTSRNLAVSATVCTLATTISVECVVLTILL